MSKLASSVIYGAFLVGSLALVACGGDDDDGGIIITTDGGGGGGGDGGGGSATCNPVSQSGCSGGEKCASVTVSDGIYQTKCVPDGTVATGGTCANVDVTGEGTTDDCLAGNECVAGVCQEVCTTAGGSGLAGSCSNAGDVCAANWSDLYVDVADTGICAASCDVGTKPAGDACAGDRQGCFFFNPDPSGVYTGECLPASPDGFPAGDPWCTDFDNPVGCFSNSCAIGNGPHMAGIAGGTFDLAEYQNELFGNTNQGICSEYCTPDGAGGQGNCSTGQFRCGYLGSFELGEVIDGNRDAVPDTVGICFDTANWGQCDAQDRTTGVLDIGKLWTAEADTPLAMTAFITGCYTGGEVYDALEATMPAMAIQKYGSKDAAMNAMAEKLRKLSAQAQKRAAL